MREVMMLVQAAKALARQWVSEEASAIPGFAGAFFHGSTTWLADDAVLPANSDVDIMVALDDPTPPVKLGKFLYHGALLEVSFLQVDQIRSPEVVLGQSDIAGSFRAPGIIADPSGHLALIQAAVARNYAKRRWVRARCEHATGKIVRNLDSLRDDMTPLHDQVSAWLFGTGVTTHVLLVAGLKNPTVRRRYVAARELLSEYGRLDVYEELLELLGCADMAPARVEQHLAALAEVFDAAKNVLTTPFFFASDISDAARPISIDGSQALIDSGLHREAIFWIVATYARCQKVLYQDAPEGLRGRFDPGFRALLADLGVETPAQLRASAERVRAYLPRLWEVAEAIMDANPGIEADQS